MGEPLENKKVAMIIAFRDFNEEEYLLPRQVLESAGAEITVVSDSPGTAIGVNGEGAQVNMLLKDLDPRIFDAIVFIGGVGCLEHLDNEVSYKILKEAVNFEITIAAICISPVILAKAGVLKDKTATVWSSLLNKSSLKILKENGVIYQNALVIIDEKIITASGAEGAREFGEAIMSVLTI